MNSSDSIVKKYTKLVVKYGLSYRTLDWGSQQSQQLRFKILSEIAPLEGTSILDVGCGLCDFYQYLLNQGINVDYHGIDITPNMVKKAQQRFPDADIELKNIVSSSDSQNYDYVVASGIFYLLPSTRHVEDIIKAMFSVARLGVAFNSLSDWGGDVEEGELVLTPEKTVSYCKNMTKLISLRHEYMPHDFTMFLYKEMV